MKSIIALGLVLVMSTSAYAVRYITCDPQEGVTHHRVVRMGTEDSINYPAKEDGSCNIPATDIVNNVEYEMWSCGQEELEADYPDGTSSLDISEVCSEESTVFRKRGKNIYIHSKGLKIKK